MQTHRARVRWPMRYFGQIAVPPSHEEPDLTNPENNSFIPTPDDPGPEPPEFAPTGEHRPADKYQDPRKNNFIPTAPA